MILSPIFWRYEYYLLTYLLTETGGFVQMKAKKRLLVGGIVFIWLAVMAFHIAVSCISTVIADGTCMPDGLHSGGTVERIEIFLKVFVSYLLPLCFMVVCYSRLIHALRRKVHDYSMVCWAYVVFVHIKTDGSHHCNPLFVLFIANREGSRSRFPGGVKGAKPPEAESFLKIVTKSVYAWIL